MTAAPRDCSRRLRREARTVEIMIRMYCRHTHGAVASASGAEAGGPAQAHTTRRPPLCPECAGLLDYTLARIDACRFGESKPTCAHCTVHCFRPSMRVHIAAAMRYGGPRMTYRHPYLAARHLMDLTKEPATER